MGADSHRVRCGTPWKPEVWPSSAQQHAFLESSPAQRATPVLPDHDRVLESHTATSADSRDPDQRLERKRHPSLQGHGLRSVKGLADVWRLIGANPDAMADEQADEMLFQTVLRGGAVNGARDVVVRVARLHRGRSGLKRCVNSGVYLLLPAAGLATDRGARHVGVIAVPHRTD